MEMSLQQFRATLATSGAITAEELDAFEDSLPPAQRPANTQQLARLLVQHRKLTKYQAAHVYQGKQLPLVLGSYVILEKIGAGGMGHVYKAHHRRLDRLAAIKILPGEMVDSPDAVQRFHQEVKTAARLTHPNIVITYDAGEQDGVHYLVMEYVPGKDLASIVKQQGPLPEELAVECLMQSAAGLAYAHDCGIIHRDIKPSNLLLASGGHESPESSFTMGEARDSTDQSQAADAAGSPVVKILDMGLARMSATVGAESGDDGLTRTGQIMGSVDYMSPEQAMDTRAADERSDIYSLGCTLFVLLTGRIPYRAKTLMQKLMAHRETPTPSVRDKGADVSDRLAELCRQMMAKQPEERPQTMREVMRLLEECREPSASPSTSAGDASAPSREITKPPPRPAERGEVPLAGPGALVKTPPPVPPPVARMPAAKKASAKPGVADGVSPHQSSEAHTPTFAGIAATTTGPSSPASSLHTWRERKRKQQVLAVAGGIAAVVGLLVVAAGIFLFSWLWPGGDENASPEDAGGEAVAVPIAGPDEQTPNESAQHDDGTIALFNGSDLDNWRFRQAGWVVQTEDGESAMTQGPVGGDIWTNQQFGNYVLQLEFKMSPRCNSGIFIHGTDISLPAAEQLEIQIVDPARATRLAAHHCGAIYGQVAPDRDAAFPASYWNRLKVTARDNFLTVELNNERIHYLDLDGFPEFRGKRRGHIGIQDHTGRIWIRNVRLTPLE